jgi:murein DD-endopeptidase MepM/ murein hydrolase activator NlpD
LPSQAPILLDFGADWLWARGINDGLWKKHAGVDLGANPGTNVLATWDGIVRVAAVDPVWGGWVTIEHTTAQNMCVVYTSVYHHLVIAPGIAQGVAVNRCRILGTVFNPAGRFQPHLHFGIRRGAYRNTSNRGALPRQLPDGPSDPVFAEAFVRPF